MALLAQQAGQKRKVGFDKATQPSNVRKRQKSHDARAIPTQRPDAAMSANGELNISSFIKAREFEIGALEKSMRKARKRLSARAFQQVPRHMRRRTASHNAKKVPQRLRRRAEREMKEDNTPTVNDRTRTPSRKLRLRLDTAKILKRLNQKRKTVRQRRKEKQANAQQSDPAKHVLTSRVPRLKKNELASAPTATTKYKRRQVNKTWLPTHLWHTKRAHMTRPTEPLWRAALPLNPTEKSYRPSHRAAGAQGCLSWDASYMSTVACWGTQTALESLLKALAFSPQGLSAALQKKWKAGTRFACGWISERDDQKRAIAPVTILWFPPEQSEVVQPGSERPGNVRDFSTVVQAHSDPVVDEMEVENGDQDQVQTSQRRDGAPHDAERKARAAKRKTKLDHKILIRLHPSAFHQFWLELLKVAKMQKPQVLVEDLRFEVGSIEVQGPGSTEALLGVLRPFSTEGEVGSSHESLWTSLAGLNNPSILPQNAMLSINVVDPRLHHPPKQIKIPPSPESSHLNELLVSWSPDKTPLTSSLLSHKTRWSISKTMPSQKAISRRRALAVRGQSPSATPKDPRIPVLLLASKAEKSVSKNSQGTWTVLLPWNCVDPVWRSLMYYPLSSGGTPRFGGLKQKQQLAFEQQVPWFPGDMPGTEAGKAWERTESEMRFDDWIRRPPKHRIAWDMLDLGLGRRREVGRGWSCDWEYLVKDTDKFVINGDAHNSKASKEVSKVEEASQLLTQRQRKAAKAKEAEEVEQRARSRNTSSPETDAEVQKPRPSTTELKYTQLSPLQSSVVLESPTTAPLPQSPVLMSVCIKLLDKGTPSPAARVYRLPSIPRPKEVPVPAQPNADGSAKSQDSEPQSWPSDGPPPAQPLPDIGTTDSSDSPSTPEFRARDLRERWLALDIQSLNNKPIPKLKVNKSNVPRHQATYPRESLAKINVLPKNAPQEIIDKWGPDSAFGRGNGEIPKQMPPPPKNRKQGNQKSGGKGKRKRKEAEKSTESNPLDAPDAGPEDIKALLINPFEQPTEWDKHVPCPDVHDLIGFVTSGGYNLAEGRGTAIGGVWVQRLVQGWEAEKPLDEEASEKGRERRKRLCIVRNAGESVGRLGIWELC
ncbi:Ribonucleases P/MRP protein subunit pop1 [Cladophialophora chaetospira]|uniref:Ribonucleases P/MRP protein subunit pop1 n=1 Tax=Cladophialophora chaetospira TaxID=386627 RepID=A0AA38XDS3_9EURO|nr:Ribonucleases P/MRP protein subunit pop1 [Cladophialophora chaetospira]